MRIGIGSYIDLMILNPFFDNEADKKVLSEQGTRHNTSAVHTLILELLKQGHFLRVFTISKTNFILKGNNIDVLGIEQVKSYPTKYLWADFIHAKRLRTIMKDNLFDLDVLHAQWTYSYAYASRKFSAFLPVFCTVRDWAPYIWKIESLKNKVTWTFKYILWYKVIKDKSIYLIANSEYTAELIKEKTDQVIPVIPNPIKNDFILEKENNNCKGLRLISISNSIDKRKNIQTLLIAFKELKKEYPEGQLLLVGEPFVPKNPIVQDWQTSNLLNGVQLCGNIEHHRLPELIDSSHIYVSSSLEETFGNTLLEAMARNKPVIGGEKSGAIPYVLSNGKAGFLCDVSDYRSIKNMISYVHSNPKEVIRKTAFARKKLLDSYLDKEITIRTLNYYQRVLLDRK